MDENLGDITKSVRFVYENAVELTPTYDNPDDSNAQWKSCIFVNVQSGMNVLGYAWSRQYQALCLNRQKLRTRFSFDQVRIEISGMSLDIFFFHDYTSLILKAGYV